jgi:hypothetical protein
VPRGLVDTAEASLLSPLLFGGKAASQGRDARTGDGRDGVEDASGQTETGTVSRGSVEVT